MRRSATAALALAAVALTGTGADAQRTAVPDGCDGAVIVLPSGNLKMGVRLQGSLNLDETCPEFPTVLSESGTGTTGLRYVDGDGNEFDATSAGRADESWGIGYELADGTRESAWANAESGDSGLSEETLTVTPGCLDDDTVPCSDALATAKAGSCVKVSHFYKPSQNTDASAFEVEVNIVNECDQDIVALWYERGMDWDIDPTPFTERVSLVPGNAEDLECLNMNGMCSGNPFADCAGDCAPGSSIVNDMGDLGATFRFKFVSVSEDEPLEMLASKTITSYYGATSTLSEANAAMQELEVEAYSYGQPGNPALDMTFFFGFSGITGTPPPPPPLPPTGTTDVQCDCALTRATTDGRRVGITFAEQADNGACERVRA